MTQLLKIAPILALMLMPPCRLKAQQTTEPAVVVELNDESSMTFLLSATPRISCSDNIFKLTTNTDDITMDITSVKRFYLAEQDVSGMTAVKHTVEVRLTGHQLNLRGLRPGSKVSIFAANGQVLTTRAADTQGTATFDLQRHHGVIIVNTHNQSFKLIRQ